MFKDKLKNFLIKKEDEPNKKKIENLVFFIIILIITIIVINVIWNDDKKNENNIKPDSNKKLAENMQEIDNGKEVSNSTEDKLVIDLENILSKINGVGEVNVMVTYAETSKTLPVYNEESTQESTEEKDSRWWNKKSDTDR